MPISLRARTVYPVDGEPLDGGVVTIEGERIVAVGMASQANGPIQDLGDVALFPSFVNAHAHLEFSHRRTPLGHAGMPLIEWLPLAIAERGSHGSSVADSIALGLQESLLAGTCAIGEITTADVTSYSAAANPPITSYLEVIGFSRARAASAFAALLERLAQAGGSQFEIGLSPHAPYTVSPELLGKLVEFARDRRLPVSIHVAESAEELDLLATGGGPFRELLEARSMWDPAAIPADSRPLDYLRRLADAPRTLVIHGNYLTPDEHEFLAANDDRMTLVYCPRTHAYFRHAPYPLAKLVEMGVRVALGTDSRASNPDLSVLGELQLVSRTHPQVPAEAVLAMATLNAAEALNRQDECGSITPGKLANLVAIPSSAHSLAELLSANTGPATIWFRGSEV